MIHANVLIKSVSLAHHFQFIVTHIPRKTTEKKATKPFFDRSTAFAVRTALTALRKSATFFFSSVLKRLAKYQLNEVIWLLRWCVFFSSFVIRRHNTFDFCVWLTLFISMPLTQSVRILSFVCLKMARISLKKEGKKHIERMFKRQTAFVPTRSKSISCSVESTNRIRWLRSPSLPSYVLKSLARCGFGILSRYRFVC